MDGQVDALHPSCIAAIGKADPIKPDFALRNGQVRCRGAICQGMRWRQGAHAILNLAHIGVQTHQGETDPTGHLRQPQADRPRGRNIARRYQTHGPVPQGTANQQHRQYPRQRHQPEPKGD